MTAAQSDQIFFLFGIEAPELCEAGPIHLLDVSYNAKRKRTGTSYVPKK